MARSANDLLVLARVSDVRPQQPGAGHDVPLEFHHRCGDVAGLDGDEPGLLRADLRVHAESRSGSAIGLGEVPVLRLPGHDAASSTAWCRRFFMPNCRRIQRTDPHRQPRLRPA